MNNGALTFEPSIGIAVDRISDAVMIKAVFEQLLAVPYSVNHLTFKCTDVFCLMKKMAGEVPYIQSYCF